MPFCWTITNCCPPEVPLTTLLAEPTAFGATRAYTLLATVADAIPDAVVVGLVAIEVSTDDDIGSTDVAAMAVVVNGAVVETVGVSSGNDVRMWLVEASRSSRS